MKPGKTLIPEYYKIILVLQSFASRPIEGPANGIRGPRRKGPKQRGVDMGTSRWVRDDERVQHISGDVLHSACSSTFTAWIQFRAQKP